MKLFIDLRKGGQTPSVGRDTPTEDQSVAEDESSYARRYEGVASGESLDPDSPDVGAKWKHEGQETASDDVSETRKKRTKEAKSDGVVKSEAQEYLDNLNKSMRDFKESRTPNSTEQEFLRDELGYTQDDINKGLAIITGKNRGLFNRWLCDRLTSSTDTLAKSVGVYFG